MLIKIAAITNQLMKKKIRLFLFHAPHFFLSIPTNMHTKIGNMIIVTLEAVSNISHHLSPKQNH